MNKVYNILFICTGNSARSIIAEALLNELGQGKFKGFSAGSHPTGKVNPHALSILTKSKINIQGLRSKNWEEFSAPDSPQMDFVFTVCDAAAGEACPVWTGHPMRAHWGADDPAAVSGSDEEIQKAFKRTMVLLKRRIELFIALPVQKLDGLALKAKVNQIGQVR